MNLVKSQRGYALVIVLLLIILFLGFSTTFIFGSLSHAKQEVSVDTKNHAVTAAEMGIQYFKTTILNTLEDEKPKLIAYANSELNKVYEEARKIGSNINIEYEKNRIRSEIATMLGDSIQTALSSRPSSQEIDSLISFEKDGTINVSNSSDNVTIIGQVKGRSLENSLEKTANLKLSMNIPIPPMDLMNDNGGSSGNNGNENLNPWLPPPFTSMIPSEGFLNCGNNFANKKCFGDNNTQFGDLNNTELLLTNYYKPTGNIGEDLKGSTIYNKGNFIAHNANNLSNGELYINGDAEFHNLNNLSNIYLQLNGTMSLNKKIGNGNTKMSKSTLYLNGSLHAGQLSLENSSTTFIQGLLQVDKNTTLKNNSKICVRGDVFFNGNQLNVDGTSKIYYTGKLENKSHNNNPNIIQKVTEGELVKNCPIYNPHVPTPDTDNEYNNTWQTPEIDIEY